MTLPYAVTDVDINRVSESFVQSRLSDFAVSTLPKALCLDRFTGRSNTITYDLAELSNSLLAGTDLRDWAPGIDPPAPTTLAEASVSLTVRIRSTLSIPRPLRRGATFENRFADLERNIVPIQLSKVYQAHDADIAAAMVNTNLFTRKNFTVGSSGKSLNDADDYANQNPVKDIEQNLVLLRPYVNFSGMELRCYMSGKVASVLATHPAYTGGGSGSAVASGLPRADFLSRFSSLHGCKTYVFDNLTNSAALGASATIVETFNQANSSAVLFFGLFDTRGNFDLRSQESADAPDGCLVWASSQDPEVVQYLDERKQVQEFWGRCGYTIYSPRGGANGVASDLGFFMRAVTSGTDGGVFAS